MKVVILDDEEKVSKLLCALIDWEGLGLTLAGTGFDGTSGLAIIKETSPDLLITDIRMPGIDGLELISEAKKILPDLQVIIVSGYSQFDYAQTAIRYGVLNYILKPIKQQELNDTLRKITAEHRTRLLSEEKTRELENIVRMEAERKRREALLDAVLTENDVDDEAIKLIDLPFPARIIVIQIDVRNPPYDFDAAKVLSEKLCAFIDEKLSLPHVFISQKTCCLLAVGKDTNEHVYTKELLAWCKMQAALFQNFLLTISCGSLISSAAEYSKSAKLAFQGIWRRLTDGTLCVYEDVSIVADVNFDVQPSVMRILSALMQGERARYDEAFALFKASLLARVPEPFQYAPFVVEAGKSVIEEVAIHSEVEDKSAFESLTASLETSPSVKRFWENAAQFFDELYNVVETANQNRLVRPVREAQSYIATHYRDKNLSLVSVADYVGLNSTYFSDLFKKSCPEGFSGYLQNVRLEKAKELLKNTKNPIKQIASDVGYADPKHFSKVFKSVTGIKPNEYRQIYE